MILILAFSSLVVRFHAIYFALSGRDQTLQYISFQSENFALSRIRLSVSIILKCSSSYRIATVSIILQKRPLSIFIFHALLMAYVKEQRIWQKLKKSKSPTISSESWGIPLTLSKYISVKTLTKPLRTECKINCTPALNGQEKAISIFV